MSLSQHPATLGERESGTEKLEEAVVAPKPAGVQLVGRPAVRI